MEKSRIAKLLSGMCCSVCRHDFDEDAVSVLRREKDMLVLRIQCPECGKGFGIALFGGSIDCAKEPEPLEFKPCPMPINYDDVLDAHNFFDKLEKDWTKYIPDNLK